MHIYGLLLNGTFIFSNNWCFLIVNKVFKCFAVWCSFTYSIRACPNTHICGLGHLRVWVCNRKCARLQEGLQNAKNAVSLINTKSTLSWKPLWSSVLSQVYPIMQSIFSLFFFFTKFWKHLHFYNTVSVSYWVMKSSAHTCGLQIRKCVMKVVKCKDLNLSAMLSQQYHTSGGEENKATGCLPGARFRKEVKWKLWVC